MDLTAEAVADAAPLVARREARALLQEVIAARARLDDTEDVEALHDFRVAMRRLRSWLRAYRPVLSDTVRRRMERRLRAIANGTNVARNVEVQLEILDAIRQRPRPPVTGIEWLANRLRRHRADAELAFREVLRADFDTTVTSLAHPLDQYLATVSGMPRAFGQVTADLLEWHCAELVGALSSIHEPGQREDIHAARITGKRLRYLLARLDHLIPEADELYDDLGELQDTLGDYHDADIFADEIQLAIRDLHERPGIVIHGPEDARDRGFRALSRLMRWRARAAFARSAVWRTPDRHAALTATVHGVAAQLRRLAHAGIEIERKYLLRAMPAVMPPSSVATIDQGYIPGERLIERMRRTCDDTGTRYYRTIKTGSGVARVELEEETTAGVYAVMWELTEGRRIRKRRHTVRDNGLTWEVDEFTDRQLVLAEVELDDADAIVVLPPWIEPVVERDVTGDAKYTNHSLAQ
jgi:CHAD domain-containing protein/CYTH domain-containing protein